LPPDYDSEEKEKEEGKRIIRMRKDDKNI
jgi:hypothetical protein